MKLLFRSKICTMTPNRDSQTSLSWPAGLHQEADIIVANVPYLFITKTMDHYACCQIKKVSEMLKK